VLGGLHRPVAVGFEGQHHEPHCAPVSTGLAQTP
jgi:hypothetical protein